MLHGPTCRTSSGAHEPLPKYSISKRGLTKIDERRNETKVYMLTFSYDIHKRLLNDIGYELLERWEDQRTLANTDHSTDTYIAHDDIESDLSNHINIYVQLMPQQL